MLITETHSMPLQGHPHTAHWHLPGTKALWGKAKGRGHGPSAQWAVLRSCLLPGWPHSILQRPWRTGKSLSGGHHQGKRCFGSPATTLPIPGSYELSGMIWERPRLAWKPENRNAVCHGKHTKQWQKTKAAHPCANNHAQSPTPQASSLPTLTISPWGISYHYHLLQIWKLRLGAIKQCDLGHIINGRHSWELNSVCSKQSTPLFISLLPQLWVHDNRQAFLKLPPHPPFKLSSLIPTWGCLGLLVSGSQSVVPRLLLA